MADNTRHLTFAEVVAIIEARSIPEPNTGCLLWEGGIKHPKPGKTSIYGNVRLNGRMVGVHRVMFEAAYGPLPAGAQVLHRCDVGLCCNPAHLFLGDNASNIADKVAKDRASKKLTREKAMAMHEMKAAGVSQPEIARRFGVNQSTVSRIITGLRRSAAAPISR